MILVKATAVLAEQIEAPDEHSGGVIPV